MATEGGGKIKSKRNLDMGKPYGRNKSFFGRVTERVKDMKDKFVPSWLMPRSKKKPGNHDQEPVENQQADGQVSSTSYPIPTNSIPPSSSLQQSPFQSNISGFQQSSVAFQPSTSVGFQTPSVSFQSAQPFQPGSSNYQSVPSSFPAVSFQPGTSTPALSGGLARMPLRNNLAPVMEGDTVAAASNAPMFSSDNLPFINYDGQSTSMIVNGGDDRSELSEYSITTSGCSSMMPISDKKDYPRREPLQLNETRIHQLRQQLGGSLTPSKELEAQSTKLDLSRSKRGEKSFLWSEHSSRLSAPQPPAKRHKPEFNVSVFGTSLSHKSSKLNTSLESPYYAGKTSYGGASSLKRRHSLKEPPLQRHLVPLKKQVSARPLNSSVSGVSSSTAKRILDTLERMSTPVKDAKKIPMNSSLLESPLSFTPSSYRRRSMPPKPSLTRGGMDGPPVHALQTPGRIQVAKNLQWKASPALPTLTEGQMSQQQMVGSGMSGQQNSRSFVDSGGGAGSKSGKMKRERQHYTREQSEEEQDEMPDLSTNFILPVSNFSEFKLNAATSVAASGSSEARRGCIAGGAQDAAAATGGAEFTFSAPIEKLASGTSLAPPASFQFSSPLAVNKSEDSATATTCSNFSGPVFRSSDSVSATREAASTGRPFSYDPTAAKRRSEPCDTGASPVPPSAELNSGSVMSALDGEGATGIFQPASELKKGSVMDILGKNTLPDTPKKDPTFKGGSSSQPLSELFKQSSSTWTCPTCMIDNKDSASNCAACETLKPHAKPEAQQAPTKVSAQGAPSLSNLFKKPTGSWTCPTCMVQNSGKMTTCPACQTHNPSSKGIPSVTKLATSAKAGEVSAPASGARLSALFKKPEGSWECDTCMVTNKLEATKCVACETQRPGLKRTSSFTTPGGFAVGPTGGMKFGGFPSASSDAEAAKDSASSSLKRAGFQFGNTLDKNGNKTDSDAAESGGINFGSTQSATGTGAAVGSKTAPAGGFKFGQVPDLKNGTSVASSEAKSDSGGFKFGSSSSTTGNGSKSQESTDSVNQSSAGGFQFGAVSSGSGTSRKDVNVDKSEKKSQASGGFSFDKVTGEKSNDAAGGLKFEVPAAGGSGVQTVAGNSQFKATEETKQTNVLSSPSAASFQFGAGGKLPESSKPLGVGGSGGFNFKSGDSAASSSLGSSTEVPPASDQATATGLFAFGGSKPGTLPNGSGTSGFSTTLPSSTDSKPAPASFGFGAKPGDAAPSTTTAPMGNTYSFSDKPTMASASSGAALPASTGSYSFSGQKPTGQAATTTTMPFAFGGGAGSAPSAAPLAESAGGKAAPAAAPASMFSYNQGAPALVENKAATSTTPSMFQFNPAAAAAAGNASFSLGKRSLASTDDRSAAKKGNDEDMQINEMSPTGSGLSPTHGSLFRPGLAPSTSSSGTVLTVTGSSSSMFKFGQNTSNPGPAGATKTSTAAFGGFSASVASTQASTAAFGTPATTAATALSLFSNPSAVPTTTAASAFGGFGAAAFGSSSGAGGGGSSNTPATVGFGTASNAPATAFGSSAAPPPAFGSSSFGVSSTSAAPAPGFGTGMFASPANSQAGSTSASTFSSTPSLQFGAAPPAQTPAVFQFGVQANPAGGSSAGAFAFGQQPAQGPAVTGSAANPPAAVPTNTYNPTPGGFNFAAAAPANPAAGSAAFQFNAGTPSGPANPFSVGGPTSNSASGRRPIKKAVRKMRK